MARVMGPRPTAAARTEPATHGTQAVTVTGAAVRDPADPGGAWSKGKPSPREGSRSLDRPDVVACCPASLRRHHRAAEIAVPAVTTAADGNVARLDNDDRVHAARAWS